MTLHLERLRRGEWTVGLGAVVLLLSFFVLDWYSTSFHVIGSDSTLTFTSSIDGWDGHTILRWFVVATVLAGLALWLTSATADTDAIPMTLAVVVFDIALVTTIALAWRVIFNEPGPNALISVRVGAWIGLAGSLAVAVGAYLTLRDEDRRGAELVVPVTRLNAPGREAAPPTA